MRVEVERDLSQIVPGIEVEGELGTLLIVVLVEEEIFLPRQYLPRHMKPFTEQRMQTLLLSSCLLMLGR